MLDLTNVIFSIEEGSKVQMYDALSDEISNSDTTAATLEVNGLGEFNLRKTSIIKGTNLKLDGLFKLKDGANLEGKSIDNKRLFSTVDGELNTVEVESFKNNGKIEMEVWREGGNDNIKTRDVEIEGNSVLKIVANTRRFDKRTYKMLEYTGNCSGKFKYVEMDENFGRVTSVNYDHNGIFVTLEGKGLETKFRNTKDLTRNQKSVAIAYDNISKTSKGEMDKIIEKIDLLSIYNQEATKKVLRETSGYFLANMIRNGTRDEGKRLIDERMEEREQNKNPEMWGKAEWNYVENKEDEKKEGDCIDRNITGIIGYDKIIKKDKYDDKFMLLGGFIKISEHNVKQGKNNEGKLVKSGIGFIGKVEGKKREIRAIVDGSYDIYDTKRCVRFEAYNRGEFEEVEEVNRIEGKFKGIGIGCNVEGAIKLRTKKNIIVRPYIGMEARVNNYDKIKEDGAGFGLVVEGNSYTRVLGRLGIGVRQDKEWYSWNVKGEYKLLLSKEVPTIKAGFDGSNEKFEVVGNEEGR
jgi:hypothetical protein